MVIDLKSKLADRDPILLGASFLDLAMEQALQTKMEKPPGGFKKLFAGDSDPLRTLSSKIKMAAALRIVDEPTYHDCNRIRDIRNRFAHSVFDINFGSDDGDVANWIQNPRDPWKVVDSGAWRADIVKAETGEINRGFWNADHKWVDSDNVLLLITQDRRLLFYVHTLPETTTDRRTKLLHSIWLNIFLIMQKAVPAWVNESKALRY